MWFTSPPDVTSTLRNTTPTDQEQWLHSKECNHVTPGSNTYGHIRHDWNRWCVRVSLLTSTPLQLSDEQGTTKLKGALHELSWLSFREKERALSWARSGQE